ncbi:hypothetical protein D9V29_12405 [Mycetocola manganoxydans]|uniref:G domain-containing protein n=2 Tax=Mycetocola manganoxydans TaxID=699879 RepID=A0A3L6ZMC7_9MICO|nr:hypothetical protein D9V29_12405 [Mycetocola manganoxydans]GHD51739.1 hypothetical protein GCM10008097_26910 [Mycetocola manganoxydans]
MACAGEAARALELAAEELEGLTGHTELHQLHVAFIDGLRESSSQLASVREDLAGRDVERPFRVVLMGRTMAGKSTLFEYLSGGDGTRVGDGGQRYTREISIRTAIDLDVEIVDTPGVGAMDGQEDYETAFSQVADADLILWVATNEATQEQTGRALERLSDLGKPIFVALNCLADVSDEIGLMDMLEEPELVFGGDAEGNLAPIRRHLSKAGGQDLGVVAIHAQAARLSISGELTDDESRVLHQNSRIDSLITAIRQQRDRTAELRRLVSIGDVLRVELLETASSLADAVLVARAALEASRGSQREFQTRADRRIADAYEELNAAFAGAITSRERWIELVEVDQSDRRINQQWDQEIALLRAEIEGSGADIGQRLEAALKVIALDVADDWSQLDIGGFRDLGGRGAIWGNRLVKLGGRVAAGVGVGSLSAWAGAAAGAKIGALAGTAIGPGLGTAIGLGAGALIGLVVGLLPAGRFFDWLGDKAFRSSSEVHERRRQKVRDQLAPLLKELNEKLKSASGEMKRTWVQAVEDEVARQSAASDSVEHSLAVLLRISSEELDPALTRVDTELAREILRNIGRSRAASAVTRATRWRGAGMAVELLEPAFSEMVLFPVDDAVERMLPTSALATMPASALQVIRSLTDREITVHTMQQDRLLLTLGSPATPGVREAWEALAQAHTSIKTRINVSVEGDAK